MSRLHTGSSPKESTTAEDSQYWRGGFSDTEISWVSRETGLPWIGDGCGLRIWDGAYPRDGGFTGCELDAGNRGGHPMGV